MPVVRLFDTHSQLAPLREELARAMREVLDSGRYILGANVEAFEQEFAHYLGVRHAVGVANGTDALTLALRALGVGEGDDVVVPSFTFYATAEAVVPTGARPVFCDVEPDTCCVSADTVRAALTSRTKAVIAVHLFGNVAPVKEIQELGVPVIEDAAQAAGSFGPEGKAGALGEIATFSFFPSKNLPCLGDGGAVTTNNSELAERVRILRSHGSLDKRVHVDIGYNSRLDELQAAVLRVLLPELNRWCDARREVGRLYEGCGVGEFVRLPLAVEGACPAWHLYVVKTDKAEALREALALAGVESRGYYRVPIHRQPGFVRFAPDRPLPATDELAATNLALPMAPTYGEHEIEAVAGAVKSFFLEGPRSARS